MPTGVGKNAFTAKKRWGKLAAAFNSVNKANLAIKAFTPKPKKPASDLPLEDDATEYFWYKGRQCPLPKVACGDKRGRSQSMEAITQEQMDKVHSRDHAIGLIRMAHAFDEDINVRFVRSC
jgi:hypothetical protein